MILVRLMREKPSRAQDTENSDTAGQETAVAVEGWIVLIYIHSEYKRNYVCLMIYTLIRNEGIAQHHMA